MALIQCDECHSEVSSRAVSCPRCGAPIAPTSKVTTIQQTDKTWKSMTVAGWILLIVGLFWTFLGSVPFGLSIVAVAVLTGAIGEFGAWWNNR